MRISDWSSDVCSSDLPPRAPRFGGDRGGFGDRGGYGDRGGFGDRGDRGGFGGGGFGGGDRGPRFPSVVAQGDFFEAKEIGRAAWRERVCQYVSIAVVAAYSKKKDRPLRRRRT